MPEIFKFQPYRPINLKGIAATGKCCVCGTKQKLTDMRYVGPFHDAVRDLDKFSCKFHDRK